MSKKTEQIEDTEFNEEFDEDIKIESKDGKKKQKLQDLPGIGPATVEKLEAVGYRDLMSVAVATPGELIDATGMNQANAKKIIAAARANLDMGFASGEDLLKKRASVFKITTGSKEFDKLMDGGFETGAITEAYGCYGSSKTQVAHQLAVTTQLPRDQGGADGTVVFIDTENTFRPERILQITKRYDNLDPDKVLKNIMIARAFNSDHQMLLAEKIEELIQKGNNVRLVIVDSLTAHFRAEFIGRGTLAERQQKLNRHMHSLAKVADAHNVCVYVTNQVMSKPDQFFGDPTEAIGGHIVGHNSTFRIYLRKGKKGSRVAKLVDSPNLAEGEIAFNVTEQGVEDL